MNSGIPFIAEIPVEKENKWNKEIETEVFYEKQREAKIRKTFNNPKSNLRRVANYIWQHLNDELSYPIISNDLKISEKSIKLIVSDLNFYNGFPITLIPIPKMKGYIQSVLDNEDNYEKWDRKKMKTITSMNQVKAKAEIITSSKKRNRKKIKVKA